MRDLDAATGLRFRGVPVEVHERLTSTNDEAFRRAAEGAPEGLVVASGHQRAGRGRLGRAWWDAPGSSVLASALLRPPIPLSRYPLLGMAAACAVAEAAARLVPAERFDVKWPNDVLHGRRKLSGVLAETRVPDTSAVPPIVVGFGVNVNQRDGDWPEEIRPIATSLRVAAGDREFDPALVLRQVLERYDRYVALAAAGDADGLWDAVRSRLPAVGTPLVVVSSERRVEGTVDGYEPTGALRLRDASGTVHTLAAGEIPLDPGTSGGART